MRYRMIILCLLTIKTLSAQELKQSDEAQIINEILEGRENLKLINQVSKYRGPLNVASLFNDAIASKVINDYSINNYLNEQEVAYLTSEETLNYLSTQKINRGLWTDILLDDSTFEVIDISNVNITVPDSSNYPFYAISNPRLDKQRRYALVHVDWVEGFLTSGSIIYFLKKENGKWQLVESFERTIS